MAKVAISWGADAWGARRGIVALALTVAVTGCGADGPVDVSTGPVAAIAISSGADQIGTVAEELPVEPAVVVTDVSGRGVPGVLVSFAVTAGGGAVLMPTVASDDEGVASTPWILGKRVSDVQRLLAAAVDPASGASFAIEIHANPVAGGPDTLQLVSGEGQVGSAGVELPLPLVVRVADAYDNLVGGAEIVWTVTGGGTLTPTSTVTLADGLASVRWRLGSEIEASQSATATLEPLTSVTFHADSGLPSRWETLEPMPVAVRAAAAAAYDRRVYVVGGTSLEERRTKRLQIYDVLSGTWSFGPDVPVATDWASAAFVGGRLHFLGGVTASSDASTQHWIYDPTTGVWSSGAPLPIPAAGSAVAYDAGKIYLLGGIDGPGAHAAHTQIYDDATRTWATGASVPGPRMTWAAAWMDGRILAVGGQELFNTLDELLAYDPATDTWIRLRSLPTARKAHGAAAIGDHFCVFGGSGGEDSTMCYAPSTDRWTAAASLPQPLSEVVAVTLDGAVYVLGGRSAGSRPVAQAARFVVN